MYMIFKAKAFDRMVAVKQKIDEEDFAEILYALQDFLLALGYDPDLIKKHIRPEIFNDDAD